MRYVNSSHMEVLPENRGRGRDRAPMPANVGAGNSESGWCSGDESGNQGVICFQTYADPLVARSAAIEPVVRLSAQLHKNLQLNQRGEWVASDYVYTAHGRPVVPDLTKNVCAKCDGVKGIPVL